MYLSFVPRIGNQSLLPNEGRLVKFIKLNEPSSVYFGARGGSTFGNERVGVPPFALGGANAFAAYGQNELLTDQYYQFEAGYLRKVAGLPVMYPSDRASASGLLSLGSSPDVLSGIGFPALPGAPRTTAWIRGFDAHHHRTFQG